MQVVQAFQANHGFGVRRPIGTLRASLQIHICLGIELQAHAAQKRGQRRVSDPEKMFQGEGRATQRAIFFGKDIAGKAILHQVEVKLGGVGSRVRGHGSAIIKQGEEMLADIWQ